VPKKRIAGVADIEKVLAKLPGKVKKMQREVDALEAKIQKLWKEKTGLDVAELQRRRGK